ncbi:MAG TPA: hypothetical protein VFQ61_02800 [Polyangiaceae bacterium]|nr:hypothetical protein [Polyangiaceae bacterium]
MFVSSRRRAEVVLIAALSGVLLAPGCELPEYAFPEAQLGQGGEGATAHASCTADEQCATLSTTRTCDLRTSECVQCVPTPDRDDCGPGQFCSVNRCAVGCDRSADCKSGTTCDLASHVCVGCQGDQDCSAGTVCADGRCESSCATDETCPQDFTCCGGTCAALGSDPLHCGACMQACADDEDCVNGECGAGSGCQKGSADCDGWRGNGCEVDLNRDDAHCGVCGNDCGAAHCSGGRCSALQCGDGTADCDGNPNNACEAKLDATATCGSCSHQCSAVHGTPSCLEGTCRIVCDIGYEDCDGNTETGCETKVADDARHCGACATRCENDHGSTLCRNSACEPECAQGFQSCDGNPANGCETDIRSSALHCGSCDGACDPQHASGNCENGVCKVVRCEDGYEDCDGDPRNGCEADLNSITSCGRCGNLCSENGGHASCQEGQCQIECDRDRRDCSGGLLDGCETNTSLSVRHCGACGNACNPPSGNSAACNNGVCTFSNCSDPTADCVPDDRAGGEGCETNVASDPKHCGGCGLECFFPNAEARCVAKSCVQGDCKPGFADCKHQQSDGCETQLGTTNNCGACGHVCSPVHGSNSCVDGSCVPLCEPGWEDCDGIGENGCETPLDTTTDCGKCRAACTFPNSAAATCEQGVCRITQCTPGFGDCDGRRETGCEARLNTENNCGTCNVRCAPPHALADCSTGTCKQTGCLEGYADCRPEDAGCETLLGTSSNCEACGNACVTDGGHVSSNACQGASGRWDCAPTCLPGWDSCEGNPDNGCEANLSSPEHCGGCGHVCDLPHTALHACQAGSCKVAQCDAGYGDCNHDPEDGCELDVSADLANCGECQHACSTEHGQAMCRDGACRIQCEVGFGDCNGRNEDGCELDTTSDPEHCGTCDVACSGATPFCTNRQCKDRLEIAVVNRDTTALRTSGTTLLFKHNLQTPKLSGRPNYRAILVGVGARGNNNGARPQPPIYGGRKMWLLKEVLSSNQAWAGIYALDDLGSASRDKLPDDPGQYDISISPNDAQNMFALMANVTELRNVELVTGLLDASAGSAGGACNGTTRGDDIALRPGSLIYSAFSVYQPSNIPPTLTPTSSQTLNATPSWSNQTLFATALLNSSVTSASVRWSISACATTAQALVAIKPTSSP